jgi:hypothetical protein
MRIYKAKVIDAKTAKTRPRATLEDVDWRDEPRMSECMFIGLKGECFALRIPVASEICCESDSVSD